VIDLDETHGQHEEDDRNLLRLEEVGSLPGRLEPPVVVDEQVKAE